MSNCILKCTGTQRKLDHSKQDLTKFPNADEGKEHKIMISVMTRWEPFLIWNNYTVVLIIKIVFVFNFTLSFCSNQIIATSNLTMVTITRSLIETIFISILIMIWIRDYVSFVRVKFRSLVEVILWKVGFSATIQLDKHHLSLFWSP